MKFSKSKLVKYMFRHFIIWTLAFIFWAMMREFGQEVVQDFEPLLFPQRVRIHLAIGIFAGLVFGTMEYLFDRYIYKNVSLGKAVLIGTVAYLSTVLLVVSFGMRVFTRILGQEMSWEIWRGYIFSGEMILFVFYSCLIGFVIDIFKQIDRKLGPGNLWKMIQGAFYQPKEDERIFMFLDLKSSTALAEQLGHIQYSKLIQDCFTDLYVVEKYNAEVYQYVGDEVVLTWDKEDGLVNANCLRAFFAFKEKLASKSKYYIKKYGVVPEFKAGLNIGEIVVAEVGELKTEIAYHGDTINTAARIQEQCNVFGRNLLISEDLQSNLKLESDFSSLHVGDILLKGKSSKVNIYSVEVA